jgi:hypothetical protein
VCIAHTAKSSKTSKKSKKKQTAHTAMLTPDHTHLTFGHHKVIIATLALLPQWQACSTHTQTTDAPSNQSESAEGVGGAYKGAAGARTLGDGINAPIKLLLVGLGGGALPMFINKCIPNVSRRDLHIHVHVYVCPCACCTHGLSHTYTYLLWPSVHNMQINFLNVRVCTTSVGAGKIISKPIILWAFSRFT